MALAPGSASIPVALLVPPLSHVITKVASPKSGNDIKRVNAAAIRAHADVQKYKFPTQTLTYPSSTTIMGIQWVAYTKSLYW